MKTNLSSEQKKLLEAHHRVERDGRVRDRMKVILLSSEGWTNKAIAQALRIHPETVAQHLNEWEEKDKLKPENGGSESKLSEQQTQLLEQHLQKKIYLNVSDICRYIAQTWQVMYTVSGMTKWLKAHDFRYKQPKGVPAKADEAKQDVFIEHYLQMVADTPSNEPILFMDAVHPTMATKISHGWIKKGVDKPIETTASRTRVNIIGAIELNTMKVTNNFVETVNAQSISNFFEKLRQAYPESQRLHLILDQAGYHRSQEVKEAAKLQGITLHYLPPYSPNLNPIERLWKVMNEEVRNNVVFESAAIFRQKLAFFFTDIIPKINDKLVQRITDNFQSLKTASSG